MALGLYRAIGLFGAAIYVVAYFANQARWLKAEDWRFPAANLAGALLIPCIAVRRVEPALGGDRGVLGGDQRLRPHQARLMCAPS
jgi:hypothetical protein